MEKRAIGCEERFQEHELLFHARHSCIKRAKNSAPDLSSQLFLELLFEKHDKTMVLENKKKSNKQQSKQLERPKAKIVESCKVCLTRECHSKKLQQSMAMRQTMGRRDGMVGGVVLLLRHGTLS